MIPPLPHTRRAQRLVARLAVLVMLCVVLLPFVAKAGFATTGDARWLDVCGAAFDPASVPPEWHDGAPTDDAAAATSCVWCTLYAAGWMPPQSRDFLIPPRLGPDRHPAVDASLPASDRWWLPGRARAPPP